jgi:hypothetical protein
VARAIYFFLAVVFSYGLFSELQITAFPKLENANDYARFIFISGNKPDESIPDNWKSRTFSIAMSAAWSELWKTPVTRPSVEKIMPDGTKILAWSMNLQRPYCNAMASYDALFFFAVCLGLIFVMDDPIIPMLGVFASILMNAPGCIAPYLLPWDLPTMAAWVFIFVIYSKWRTAPQCWLWLGIAIIILGLFKETVLVTALFFIGAKWNWPRRIAAIMGIVLLSQGFNWLLCGIAPDWMFSASNAAEGGHRWNPLMLWPIVLANAGSVVLMPSLLWRNRDWPLAAVCAAFIALQALNNLACGVYDENRDWLEIAPIGWILISEWLRPRLCPNVSPK